VQSQYEIQIVYTAEGSRYRVMPLMAGPFGLLPDIKTQEHQHDNS